MEKKTIPVVGMACSACSAHVEKKLNAIKGIQSASVSLPGRSALVEYDPTVVTLQQMKAEVNGIGYDLVIEKDYNVTELEHHSYSLLRRKVIVSWFFAIACMSVSMGWLNMGSWNADNQMMLILSLFNLVYCGRQFYVTAWCQLLHASANMDTLVTMSTAISFLFSVFNTFWGQSFWGARGMEWHTYYDVSVMIITFVLTGHNRRDAGGRLARSW